MSGPPAAFGPRRSFARSALGPLALVLGLAGHLGAARADAEPVAVRSDSSRLATDVARAIEERVPLAPAASLRVASSGGVVTLTGWTSTLGARERAAAVAEGTCGVRFMRLRLAVRPPDGIDDDSLLRRLRQVLAAGRGFERPADVRLTVADGVVTLRGVTQTVADKYLAEDLVAWTDGPREIVNEIRVDPEEGVRRLRERIDRALAERGVRVEPGEIEIVVEGGLLRIDGVDHDIRRRKIVEEFLETLPGGYRLLRRETLLVTPASVPPPSYVAHPCD